VEGEALDLCCLELLKAATACREKSNPAKAKVQSALSQYANVHLVSKSWPMLYGRFMIRGAIKVIMGPLKWVHTSTDDPHCLPCRGPTAPSSRVR